MSFTRPQSTLVCRMLFVFAIALFGALQTGSLQASTFTPYACTSCASGWQTVSAWKYNVSNSYGIWDQPKTGNCTTNCPNYTNNILDVQYIPANHYVEKMQVNVSSFDLETTYDTLTYGYLGGGSASLSGNSASGWYGYTTNGGQFYVQLTTDGSITKPGVYLDQARVCCRDTAGSTGSFSDLQLYHGLLLATDDTVYLSNTSLAGSGDHIAIALWGDAGDDIDIYVRCNALPTASSYDHASLSTDETEYIHVSSSYCSGGTIYVAVNSFAGSGQFRMLASEHQASNHFTLKAGTSFTADSGQRAAMHGMLEGGARLLWGATAGLFTVNYDSWNTGNCSDCGGSACDICMNLNSNTCITYGSCGANGNPGTFTSISMNTTNWSSGNVATHAFILAHEMGHLLLKLCDEYDGSGANCGHSIMATLSITGLNSFCSWIDHETDRIPSTASATGFDDVWTNLVNWSMTASTIPYSAPQTSYYDFDFNGAVGTVTVH